MPSPPNIMVKQALAAGAFMAVTLVPGLACAALGGTEASVSLDAEQLKGSVKSLQRANYRVHEIQLASGTVMREFADSDGTVFAVAWNGPVIPNLRQALGQYFDAFASAAKANHAPRGHLQIRQSNLVMQSSGHMRAFQGRAYLPNSLPAGMSVDDIH